jgi:hypothetical protein
MANFITNGLAEFGQGYEDFKNKRKGIVGTQANTGYTADNKNSSDIQSMWDNSMKKQRASDSSLADSFGSGHSSLKASIPDFVSMITKNPLLIPNRYHCIISGPGGKMFPEEILMNIINCSIPSRALLTVEKFTKGPTTKIPYAETFEDLTITFRLSADMYERSLIDEWMNKAGGDKYGAAYFNEVKGRIEIGIYHQNNQLMKTFTFVDVVPINLGELTLSDSSEEIASIVVQFSFHHYEWK